MLDLSQRIAPIKVTDAEFAAHVRGIVSPRTKASEMEHAIRHHIREHLDEDPAYYDRLSAACRRDPREARRPLGTDRSVRGDHQRDQRRTHRRSRHRPRPHDRAAVPRPDGRTRRQLRRRGRGPVDGARPVHWSTDVRSQIAVVGFWENGTKQDELRKAVKRSLDDSNLFAYDDLDELAVDLVALAKANRERLR